MYSYGASSPANTPTLQHVSPRLASLLCTALCHDHRPAVLIVSGSPRTHCVCARAHACVRACVRACARACTYVYLCLELFTRAVLMQATDRAIGGVGLCNMPEKPRHSEMNPKLKPITWDGGGISAQVCSARTHPNQCLSMGSCL